MAVIDRAKPLRQSRFKVGVVDDAIRLPASAPGMRYRDNDVTSRLIDIQPSGCDHPSKYWRGFTPVSSYDNAAVPTVLCGTGSDSVLTKLIELEKSGSAQDDNFVAPLSHNETIAGIRSALSLQIKELAEILQVQRPTIYSWIKDEVEPSAVNRERLQQVYRIAAQWARLCKLPAERLVRAAGTDGHSVLDLLKADEIDEGDVVSRFKALMSERMKMKAEADSERPIAAAIARRHGLNPNDISDQQDLIDAETGKRSHPE